MTVSALDDYRSRLADLPANRFIGSIIWYSISGARITREDLEQAFIDNDLNPDALPPSIKKVDAFRKASSLVSREYPLSDAETVKLHVEEIDYNKEFVLRHVFRTVHNKRTQQSTMCHVATLKFFRGARTNAANKVDAQHYKTSVNSNMVEIGLNGQETGVRVPLDGVERQQVVDLIADFEQRYEDLAIYLQSDAIRALVRSYLVSLNTIQVKPTGGVYFVHSTRQRTLDNLTNVVSALGEGCTFHQVPLLDTLDQRQMLTEAFQTEVVDEVDLLLRKIAVANDEAKKKGGKISPADYARFSDTYQDVLSRSEEYTRVLGLSQGRAGSALDSALEAVIEMSGRLAPTKK